MDTDADTPCTSWEGHKGEIRRLYVEERKPLEYVKRYMEHVHSFIGTKSQYEAHFKRWNFRKNSTQDGWKIISYKYEKRKRDDEDMRVYMGNEEIPPKKLKKEISRNAPSVLERLQFQKHEPPTPPGFSFTRPISAEQSVSEHNSPGDLTGHNTDSRQLLVRRRASVYSGSRSASPDLETLVWAMRDFGEMPWFTFGSRLESKLTGLFHPDSASQLAAILKGLFGDTFEQPLVRSTATEPGGLAFPVFPPGIHAMIPPHAEDIFRLLRGRQPVRQNSFTVVLNMFKYASYLISNDLCCGGCIRVLVTWLRDSGNINSFHELLSIGGPTSQAIAEKSMKWLVYDRNAPAVHMILHHAVELFATALKHAIDKNNASMARSICRSIADSKKLGSLPKIQSEFVGVIRKAVSHGDVHIAELILTFAANLGMKLGQIQDLVGLAAWRDTRGAKTKMVLAICGPWHSRMNEIQKALNTAAECGVIPAAEALIDAGAEINFTTKPKGTALDCAANKCHFQMFRFLLQHGARIGKKQQISPASPFTTLQWAILGQAWGNRSTQEIITNRLQIARLCLENGADANDPPPVHIYGYSMPVPLRTNLQFSIEKEWEDLVLLLLEYGADIKAPPAVHGGLTATQAAVRSGNERILNILTNRGGNIIDFSPPQMSSQNLVEAAKSGHFLVVKYLLEKGADANSILPTEWHNWGSLGECNRECGTTALYYAISRADLVMADLLLAHGADINAGAGNTILQAAVLSQNSEIILSCIDLGASVYDEFAILIAFQTYSSSTGALDVLIHAVIERMRADRSRGLNASVIPNVCKLALRTAIKQGKTNIVQTLLNAGTGMDPPRPIGTMGSKELLPCVSLRAHKPPKDLEFCFQFTPLLVAAACGNVDLVRLLLLSGADVNARGREKLYEVPGFCTPLQAATYHNHNQVADVLLENSANINAPARGSFGRTALQGAVQSGDFTLVQLILDHGADPNEPPARCGGATSLQIAAIEGYIKIALLLLDHGANVNAPGAVSHGRTALEGASERGRIDMVHLLFNFGATLMNSDPQHCRRVFGRAYSEGHYALVGTLKSHFERERLSQALPGGFNPLLKQDMFYESDEDSEASSVEDENWS